MQDSILSEQDEAILTSAGGQIFRSKADLIESPGATSTSGRSSAQGDIPSRRTRDAVNDNEAIWQVENYSPSSSILPHP